MSPILLSSLALVAMFILILLHVPIGVSMAAVGVVGFGLMTSMNSGFALLSSEAAINLSSMNLAVIPLFVLMGNFAAISGVTTDLYNLANAFLGHFRGGLVMATFGGSGLFGAVCGSSVASTATFGRIAFPEMIKRGYAPSLASGCIAAGGTLTALMPPSIILVIYAVLSEQFIIELFYAAIIPAILTIVLYIITTSIVAHLFPKTGPAGPRIPWPERIIAIKKSWSGIFLIGGIAIGIYGGIFTVNEAASLGVILSFLLALCRRKLNRESMLEVLSGTAVTTGMIYMILIGANVFNYFIVISHLPDTITGYIIASGWPPFIILFMLVIIYLILGSIFDTVAAMLITMPFVLPLIIGMGYSPVWWGIINVVLVEVGMITPPMGINVYMLHGILQEYPLSTLFKGIMPFLLSDVVRIVLLISFPFLSLWLPGILR